MSLRQLQMRVPTFLQAHKAVMFSALMTTEKHRMPVNSVLTVTGVRDGNQFGWGNLCGHAERL
jgi:hypothetical protein